MHVAITPASDGLLTRRGSAARRIPAARAGGMAGEILREVPLYPMVDRAQPTAAIDFQPAERSEPVARAVNFAVALIALVALLPLIALIAIAIKLSSRGAVLYSQTRVGIDRRWRHPGIGHMRRREDLGGRPFTMYKFRTMREDAESHGVEVWASQNDPRVTLVGRFLRASRLDELPQLYNVIRGEMNVVGPRPERPSIFSELRDDIPGYALRQRVRPGITGWAQINQSYDTCIDDVRRKVQLDLEYLTQQSLVKDIRIMSATLPVMLFRKGGW